MSKQISSLAGAGGKALPLLAGGVEGLGPAPGGVAVAGVSSKGGVTWRVASVNDAHNHALACTSTQPADCQTIMREVEKITEMLCIRVFCSSRSPCPRLHANTPSSMPDSKATRTTSQRCYALEYLTQADHHALACTP